MTLVELRKKFWSKVDIKGPDECWNYIGNISPSGYGRFDGDRAHRCAYEFFNKCKIPKGKLILHKCDNPPCCNPKHLYCGTQQDNIRDRTIRRRHNSNPSKTAFTLAKFTAKQIQTIRNLIKNKYTQKHIANIFGVHPCTISDIYRARTYPCKNGYYI